MTGQSVSSGQSFKVAKPERQAACIPVLQAKKKWLSAEVRKAR